jgi:hypothetical protein
MARAPRQPRGIAQEGWWQNAFKWATAESGFTDPLLPGTRSFASPEDARDAWRIMRRVVWGTTPRLKIPDAARVFDGLTAVGRAYLWYHVTEPDFSPTAARMEIDGDRATIAAFRERDPVGADAIRDYLAMWLDDLAFMEALIPKAVAVGVGDVVAGEAVYGPLCTAKTYGGKG